MPWEAVSMKYGFRTISDAQLINGVLNPGCVSAHDSNIADLLLDPLHNDPIELGAIAVQRMKNNFAQSGH